MAESDETTRLRDIDEGMRQQIVELLSQSTALRLKDYLKQYYICLREIFYRIEPFEFDLKDDLSTMTQKIDGYLESIGTKTVNAQERFEQGQKTMAFNDYVDEYKRFVIHSLKVLNLYLRIVKRQDDPDLQFSRETFNSEERLVEGKKEELKEITSEELLGFLTPRQIHDVHARYSIKQVLRK